MGDLNTLDTDEVLSDFLEEHFLYNLVNFPTCYKSTDNPSSIDLIITNKRHSFQNTTSFSTGLSDFHKLVISSMKLTFPKVSATTITYRNMKIFDRNAFRNDLRLKLGEIPKQTYGVFAKTFLDALDDHAKQVGKSAKVSRKNLFLSSFQPV